MLSPIPIRLLVVCICVRVTFASRDGVATELTVIEPSEWRTINFQLLSGSQSDLSHSSLTVEKWSERRAQTNNSVALVSLNFLPRAYQGITSGWSCGEKYGHYAREEYSLLRPIQDNGYQATILSAPNIGSRLSGNCTALTTNDLTFEPKNSSQTADISQYYVYGRQSRLSMTVYVQEWGDFLTLNEIVESGTELIISLEASSTFPYKSWPDILMISLYSPLLIGALGTGSIVVIKMKTNEHQYGQLVILVLGAISVHAVFIIIISACHMKMFISEGSAVAWSLLKPLSYPYLSVMVNVVTMFYVRHQLGLVKPGLRFWNIAYCLITFVLTTLAITYWFGLVRYLVFYALIQGIIYVSNVYVVLSIPQFGSPSVPWLTRLIQSVCILVFISSFVGLLIAPLNTTVWIARWLDLVIIMLDHIRSSIVLFCLALHLEEAMAIDGQRNKSITSTETGQPADPNLGTDPSRSLTQIAVSSKIRRAQFGSKPFPIERRDAIDES